MMASGSRFVWPPGSAQASSGATGCLLIGDMAVWLPKRGPHGATRGSFLSGSLDKAVAHFPQCALRSPFLNDTRPG
jgi:hypothetical protein